MIPTRVEEWTRSTHARTQSATPHRGMRRKAKSACPDGALGEFEYNPKAPNPPEGGSTTPTNTTSTNPIACTPLDESPMQTLLHPNRQTPPKSLCDFAQRRIRVFCNSSIDRFNDPPCFNRSTPKTLKNHRLEYNPRLPAPRRHISP